MMIRDSGLLFGPPCIFIYLFINMLISCTKYTLKKIIVVTLGLHFKILNCQSLTRCKSRSSKIHTQ